jgi:hypothetical protein
MGRCFWVKNESYVLYSGGNILQPLEPLASYLGFKISETRDVTSWMGETSDKACTNRVSNLQEDDRERASYVLKRFHRRIRLRKEDIRFRRDCFVSVGKQPLSTTCRKEIVDLEIATYSPATLLQAFLQCDGTILRFRVIRSPHQHNNAAHTDILPTRRERPRRHDAKQRDEIAALQ